YGLPHVLRYLSTTTPLAKGLTDITNVDKSIDELNASGLMVIGTADRLIEHLKAFDKQTGGFGGFLGFGTDLADRTETLRSLELVMRDVAPVFQGQSQRLQSNFAHVQQLGSDWS